MKQIGVVSSFDVLCGNATYSEVLVSGLSKNVEVMKITIPTSIQKKYSSIDIKELINKVKRCDAINLQMELGLYGPTPNKAMKLVKKILKHTKHASLTMHRIDPAPDNLIRTCYSSFKSQKGKHKVTGLFTAIWSHFIKNMVHKIHKKIVKTAADKSHVFIVHTHREKQRILKVAPHAKVLVHPIVWPTNLPASLHTNIDSKFANEYPVLGIFGFLSPYKNFEIVLSLANSLNYNIVLGGATHPNTSKYGMQSTTKCTANSLSNIVMGNPKTPLSNFYHHTAPSDDTLIGLIKSVDLVVVPYFETGQSGSGIASLAVQYGKRVIFSDTHLINELAAFLNKKPFLFDVNSEASLASAIEDALKSNGEREIKFDGYSFKTNINTYLSSLGLGETAE